MLVGIPGSGKSTWVQNQTWTENCAYIGTDHLIERHAQSLGLTYDAVFQDYIDTATKLMKQEIETARNSNKDIIWDQTNLTGKSRTCKLLQFPDYYKICINFSTPGLEELMRRLDSRPGKNIPQEVIHQMLRRFEQPSQSEGFDEIWWAS